TQPPTTLPQDASSQSLTELLQGFSTSSGSFATLAQAVEAAGLANALQDDGSYTVFAPTDEAFAALPPGTLDRLLQPANRELLRQLLAYHVAPEELTSDELTTGALTTLGGGLAIRVTPERVVVNDGSVVRADIQAGNGVVHVVNRVMIPPDLRQQIEALQ
uniref:fasciclin domain-containing protein n=1 Tax=Oculatella sp. LEGE 06141 TaxID=1828648 RepID=UPI00187DE9AB